jgi:hypothetical protein
VRSLEALFVYEISQKAFRAHPVVKAFYKSLYEKIEPAKAE